MDFTAFLNGIRSSPAYRNQIVHSRREEAREAIYADTATPLSPACARHLEHAGIEHLYSHQAEAIDALRSGRDVLIVTGTASGKSLCYQLPLLEMLEREPDSRAILLYPTKALSQDQYQSLRRAVQEAESEWQIAETASGPNPHAFHPEPVEGPNPHALHPEPVEGPNPLLGVFDGDTPAPMRRKLRDDASIILTNPDMLHAGLLPQHTRWAGFIKQLKYVVIDELHTYNGLFGSNAAILFRRFERVCAHYGSSPQFIFCSATVANPLDVAKKLTRREPVLIDRDGSPRGPKTYIFWNPPKIRPSTGSGRRGIRTRRSANVEAHELMTDLVRAHIPTITFSKAKVTAELIHRYVVESLQSLAPHLANKIASYRGGYLAEDRREIERKLFSGELLGVSTTPALELGIDIGGLDASIMVGYPGTLAGFFQQAGRAGRRDRESLAILVAVDTSVNQYVMKHPEYIFGRPIERLVIDPENPHVLTGQLRCAAYELPISESEADTFGQWARLVLDVLTEQHKLNKVGDKWYHASEDVPQHEVSMRSICDKNVAIIDIDTNRVIGELNKYDAQPIIHPDAIYMHQGDTYHVLELDLDRMLCYVKKTEVDYYTQPIGGTDVHHIDQPLRERDFGTGKAYFGEVTSYFRNGAFEKIKFYTLDAISVHPLDLPTWQLETMAFWITPPEDLVRDMIAEGFDVHRALMGIGYATRMILPLFIQCETLDFSHSSCTAINAPWHTMFIYERYPYGLGFTEEAFEILDEVMPAVRDRIRTCDCANGCPCCVGKPLRSFTTWNTERGEASIPSKRAALRLLDGLNLPPAPSWEEGEKHAAPPPSPEHNTDQVSASGPPPFPGEGWGEVPPEKRLLVERAIRRRLEKMGDPEVFHPIDPKPEVGFPEVEKPAATTDADIARRAFKRMRLEKTGKAPSEDEMLKPMHDWGNWSKAPDYLKRPSGQDINASQGTPSGIRQSNVGPEPPTSGDQPADSSRAAKQGEGTPQDNLEHERAPSRAESKALRNLTRRGPQPPKAVPGAGQTAPPAPPLPRRYILGPVEGGLGGGQTEPPTIPLGDSIAAQARKLKKSKKPEPDTGG